MLRFTPKTVLCPVDLSSASPSVLAWARLFARTYNAKVEILHVDWLEYPAYFFPSQTKELNAWAERSRAALAESLEKLARETFRKEIPYNITILEGHPVETILKHAAQGKPDLTVMGSHGRSGIARVRLGSVAENVVQQAASPTLVVRTPGSKPVPSKILRILCPVTLDKLASESLSLSAEVAAAFRARLIVMHAEEEVQTTAANARQLCEWVPAEVRARCELVEVLRRGSAAEQILLVAREQDVDLILLTAKHRQFLDFTVIGTTTEKVMRHADSAVLVFPSGMEVVA